MKLIPLNIKYLKEKAKQKNRQPNGTLKNSIQRARNILRILERDNYMCIKCGNKEELTIDHINGRKFSKCDNASKYKLDKCQTLCVKCHNYKNENNR